MNAFLRISWCHIAFFIGFIILIELSIEDIFHIGGIADRPLFFLGMLCTIIGSQLSAMALLLN